MSLGRIAPLSGIVFVVLTAVSLVAISGKTPDIKSSQAKITAYYVKHQSHEQTAVHIVAIGILFLAIFAAACWPLMKGGRPIWPAVFYGGALLLAGGWLASGTIHIALADGAHHGVSGAALQAINALDSDTYIMFGTGLGIMLVGAGGSLIKRAGYNWLGWIALVLGISCFTPAGFIGFLGGALWIIVMSVVVYMRSDSTSAGPAPAAA